MRMSDFMVNGPSLGTLFDQMSHSTGNRSSEILKNGYRIDFMASFVAAWIALMQLGLSA